MKRLMITLVLLAIAPSLANAQQKLSFTAQDSKYIVSQNVDIGDVPNHFVRIFDTHSAIPVNGLELSEMYTRGVADVLNGRAMTTTGYLVFVAKNGDKFYSQNSTVVTVSAPNKGTAIWNGAITGGTGRFAGIQGTTRQVVTFDPSPGGAAGVPQTEIEYTIPGVAQGGTADEAKAMLVKVIAAVKADRDVALIQFTKGEAGFKEKDLYPYCVRISDGKGLSGPFAVQAGTDARTLKDANGKPFGIEQYNIMSKSPDGQIVELGGYVFPRPGTLAPSYPKTAYLARIGDIYCGVGYYK